MRKIQRLQPIDGALLAVAVIWGTGYSVVKAALGEMPPLAFNAVRFVGASSVVLALTWILERDLSIPRHLWGLVFLLGFVGQSAHLALYVKGLSLTTAINASLILAAIPIFTALIGALSRTERMSARNWAGVFLSFVGIFLVISRPGAAAQSGSTLVGDLLEVASAVCFALYLVLSKRLMASTTALKATTWTMWSAAPLLVLVAVPELRTVNWRTLSWPAWFGMAYSATLIIGIGNVIWYAGVKQVGSTRTSLYSYLTPPIALLFAWAFLGEVVTLLQILGMVAVLVGVALGRQAAGT